MTRRVIPGLEAPDPVLEREIRSRLDDVEVALEKAVLADSDMLAETSQYLLKAGGKRFRPMLVLLSGYFGDARDPRLVPGSVSIELVHQATLYHDDVIDEADARHGVPSANVRWDNTVAILTGDYLFARASEISTELGTDVCALLARTIATLCDGQIREVEAAGRVEQQTGAYMEIIRRKTGALIATSCRLGGMLSDAPAEYLDVLDGFGEALGLAFQLSDDIMDLTVSSDVLEKEPGQDLREGVYTLPILDAMNHGPNGDELRDAAGGRSSERRVVRARARDRARGRPRRRSPGRRRRGRPGPGPRRAAAGGDGSDRADPAGRVPRRPVRRQARRRDRPTGRVGRMILLGSALGKTFTSVETYYQSYGVVLAVLIAGVGLVAVAFGAARLIAPSRPLPEKLLTYECGIDPVGQGWSQSQVRYYVYGFLFVIFDVESVFLFPWARVFESLGYQAVVEMAIFVGILAVGLLYAWRKGVLKWA